MGADSSGFFSMASGCFIGNIRGYRYDDGDQDLHDDVNATSGRGLGEQEITLGFRQNLPYGLDRDTEFFGHRIGAGARSHQFPDFVAHCDEV